MRLILIACHHVLMWIGIGIILMGYCFTEAAAWCQYKGECHSLRRKG
jgi:hypothetical protein